MTAFRLTLQKKTIKVSNKYRRIVVLLSFGTILFLLLYIYINWTSVSTREININTEEIAPYERILEGTDSDKIYQLIPFCNIELAIPFSMVDIKHKENNCEYSFKYDTLRIIDDHLPFLGDTAKRDYLDSLYSKYNRKRHPSSIGIQEDTMLFYHNFQVSLDNWSFVPVNTTDKESYSKYDDDYTPLPIRNGLKKEGNTILFFNEGYNHPYYVHYIKENYGALSKPNWFDKNDISQFYFKLHVESHSLRKIRLRILIHGANDFTFIDLEPNSINSQLLTYELENDSTTGCINKDILIHVHSKELSSVQNARVFLLTTTISAIIALALRSLAKSLLATSKSSSDGKRRRIKKRKNRQRIKDEKPNGIDK